jgi:cytochrome bd ubiquinol oxidase subunit II
VFCLASILLAIFFGAALGNVVRGVPLDDSGFFFLPLWTSLMPEANAGIIDWYTVLIGIAALCSLAVHGALWVANKTDGDLQRRCRTLASNVWWAVVAMGLVITIASFRIQPHLAESLSARPWGYAFVLVATGGLLAVKWFIYQGKDFSAFLASCGFLIGALASAATGLYPYVLPSNKNAAEGLTIDNTLAAPYGLGIGLAWWTPALCLTIAYFIYTYRRFSGKVVLEPHEER